MTEAELIEAVARALAKEDGIEICVDATYAQSSYGPRARAALAIARPIIEAETREKIAVEVEKFDTFDYDTTISANRAAVACDIADAIRKGE